MSSFVEPARRFAHPDGRVWEVRLEGARLFLWFVDETGEAIERVRSFSDGATARRELETLVQEQLADGFVEVSPPAWRTFLDELVQRWAEDCPSFDAVALRDRVLALADARLVVENVMGLGAKWITDRSGRQGLDLEHAVARREHDWLLARGPEVLPALWLALRHHDLQGQAGAEAIVGELGRRESIPALLAVLEHPASDIAEHAGGRGGQHMPSWALAKLGPFQDGPLEDGLLGQRVVARLVALLDSSDFRAREAAAKVMAEHATDDRFFSALVALGARARESDGLAWASMRAAEVRPDRALRPLLEWMQSSRRFRGPGYAERIAAALARIPR
ncbi:MAG: hypothetical protein K8H88_04000 [Sandaracinaceae bacterium]|nr:hypothetical protein [Sandaracinaceae bacterium]